METAPSVFAKPPRTVWSEPVRKVRGSVRELQTPRTDSRSSAQFNPLKPRPTSRPLLAAGAATRPHLARFVWITGWERDRAGHSTGCDWLTHLYFQSRFDCARARGEVEL